MENPKDDFESLTQEEIDMIQDCIVHEQEIERVREIVEDRLYIEEEDGK
jgi:hypothetical protein